MKNVDFIITNTLQEEPLQDINLVKTVNNFNIYAGSGASFHIHEGMLVLIDGYVMPVNSVFYEYSNLNMFETVARMYRKFGTDFISYLKGCFIMIIATDETIEVFNDHLGLKTFFYRNNEDEMFIVNNLNKCRTKGCEFSADLSALAMKSLLHRVPLHYTIFRDVYKSTGGTCISIKQNEMKVKKYWTPSVLLEKSQQPENRILISDFAEMFQNNFKNFISYFKPESQTITLTGGKDSRTGLAILRSLGSEVTGFTYGNKLSRDVIYAQKLSEALDVKHQVFTAQSTEEWYYRAAGRIFHLGYPEISIFRAHRDYAFRSMFSTMKAPVTYYAGYMGGELLMGTYFDNLIFTGFLSEYSQNQNELIINSYLQKYYHNTSLLDFNEINDRLSQMKTFSPSLSEKEREFFSLFEIGIPHHSQDIYLAANLTNLVYPFFLDLDFLQLLFSSKYSFLHGNNKTHNLFKRYSLYEFNLKIQHLLAPEMDRIPFGKRGSYNTHEYFRGKFYWTFIKTLRYFLKKDRYVPNYSYNRNFHLYLMKEIRNIQSDRKSIISKIYNIPLALSGIMAIKNHAGEADLHKFANIIHAYYINKLFVS